MWCIYMCMWWCVTIIRPGQDFINEVCACVPGVEALRFRQRCHISLEVSGVMMGGGGVMVMVRGLWWRGFMVGVMVKGVMVEWAMVGGYGGGGYGGGGLWWGLW